MAGDPGRRAETNAEREARYAARDVLDKLGIKPGHRLAIVGPVPSDLAERARARAGSDADIPPFDVVLFAPTSLEAVLPGLREARASIQPAGSIWLVTAKRTAAGPDRPYVRDTDAIAIGAEAALVDNKICSISDTTTAMRFVIRRADR